MGEQLLLDWRFKFPGEPSELAYNWDYAECSTANPTPRQHHVTVFLTVNATGNPVNDLKEIIRKLNQASWTKGPKLKLTLAPLDEENDSRRSLTIHKGPTLVLTGDVHATGDQTYIDPNVGYYAKLEATTQQGAFRCYELLRLMNHGLVAVLEHTRREFDIGDNRRLVTVTGYGPDGERNDLATRFFLYESDEEVARCHLSYRDGSYDPSLGPTVEMMAVRQQHRGRTLLPLLWYWVKSFMEENVHLECFNNDAPHRHMMIKATQLNNAEVDLLDGDPVSDKEFFYDYAGFSVRVQKGPMAWMMGNRRPLDEEAVLYLPLLTPQQMRARGTSTRSPDVTWTVNRGACVCDACSRIAVEMVRCGRCKLVHYCDKNCQRRDWKRHKAWCGKSREEVHAVLREQGLA